MGSKKEELEEEKIALKSTEPEDENEDEDGEAEEEDEEDKGKDRDETKKEKGESTVKKEVDPDSYPHFPQPRYEEEMASYQLRDDCRIPRLFLKLYFGGGAILYSFVTIWVFFGCLFRGLSFGKAGWYHTLWITILIWLSTGLTEICSRLGKKLFVRSERPDQLRFGGAAFLKVFTDALIFHALIIALKDIHVDLYHEFFQFIGPLIYFALLYLVILVEIFMAFLTVALIEDSCKCFAYMEIFCKYREEFMLKYCTMEDV